MSASLVAETEKLNREKRSLHNQFERLVSIQDKLAEHGCRDDVKASWRTSSVSKAKSGASWYYADRDLNHSASAVSITVIERD